MDNIAILIVCIAATLCTCVIASCAKETDSGVLMRDMVEHGASPHEARCALTRKQPIEASCFPASAPR